MIDIDTRSERRCQSAEGSEFRSITLVPSEMLIDRRGHRLALALRAHSLFRRRDGRDVSGTSLFQCFRRP